MDNLQVQSTLPVLSFDAKGLKKYVADLTEKYQGLVVREEDVTAIKTEMAGLNKVKANLDTIRKRIVAEVSVPIKAFEDEIKAAIADLDRAREGMASQVKAYEDQQREDKRRDVQFGIDALLEEHGLAGKLVIEIEDRWLNKTMSFKDIKAACEAKVLTHLKAEADARALEQARQDRAVAIEQHAATLAVQYGFLIPASAFLRLHDLSMPLADVQVQIGQAYERRAQQAAQEEARKAQASVQKPSPAFTSAAPSPAPKPAPQPAQVVFSSPRRPAGRTMTITLEYAPEREQAIQNSIAMLRRLCMNVEINESVEA